MDPTTEHELLAAIAGGDSRAAEQLVAATYRQVFASLVRLTGGDRDLAADLTQETYRRAWRGLAGFDRRSSLGTWLYRIGYTTFLNHIRRARPEVALDEDEAGRVADVAPTALEALDHREVAARLRRAVLELPEELRFTVTARFWADLPVAEIALQEAVTGAAIRKRLKTAKARLRLALEEDAA